MGAKLTFPFIAFPCKVTIFRETEAVCVELHSMTALAHAFNQFWSVQNGGRGGLYRVELFHAPDGRRHQFYIRVPNLTTGTGRMNATTLCGIITAQYRERNPQAEEYERTVPSGAGIMWELLV